MPNKDGTGPNWQGPRTWRWMWNCTNWLNNEQNTSTFGRFMQWFGFGRWRWGKWWQWRWGRWMWGWRGQGGGFWRWMWR